MKTYRINFGMELDNNTLVCLEEQYKIPTQDDFVYIEAKTPGHAMRLFREKYNIKYRPVRTFNLLKFVYLIKDEENSKLYMYRLRGLSWDKDYEYLITTKEKKRSR